jgi:hypothetical protein
MFFYMIAELLNITYALLQSQVLHYSILLQMYRNNVTVLMLKAM